MARSFLWLTKYDALEDCLNRLEQLESLASCLHTYPELAAELEPLLVLAQELRFMGKIYPQHKFRCLGYSDIKCD